MKIKDLVKLPENPHQKGGIAHTAFEQALGLISEELDREIEVDKNYLINTIKLHFGEFESDSPQNTTSQVIADILSQNLDKFLKVKE